MSQEGLGMNLTFAMNPAGGLRHPHSYKIRTILLSYLKGCCKADGKIMNVEN